MLFCAVLESIDVVSVFLGGWMVIGPSRMVRSVRQITWFIYIGSFKKNVKGSQNIETVKEDLKIRTVKQITGISEFRKNPFRQTGYKDCQYSVNILLTCFVLCSPLHKPSRGLLVVLVPALVFFRLKMEITGRVFRG